eukprot:1162115-Pelagomonas_calceolata.AAC.11
MNQSTFQSPVFATKFSCHEDHTESRVRPVDFSGNKVSDSGLDTTDNKAYGPHVGSSTPGTSALGPGALGPVTSGSKAQGPSAPEPVSSGSKAQGPSTPGPVSPGSSAPGPSAPGPGALGLS